MIKISLTFSLVLMSCFNVNLKYQDSKGYSYYKQAFESGLYIVGLGTACIANQYDALILSKMRARADLSEQREVFIQVVNSIIDSTKEDKQMVYRFESYIKTISISTINKGQCKYFLYNDSDNNSCVDCVIKIDLKQYLIDNFKSEFIEDDINVIVGYIQYKN